MKITLAEAASILDVSKETLRNWDKAGKLKPIRGPKNNYRTYLLSDVEALRKSEPVAEPSAPLGIGLRGVDPQDKDIKRVLSKVHKIIRDLDGSSSIVERFDEVTKLLTLVLSEQAFPVAPVVLGDLLEAEQLANAAAGIRSRFRRFSEAHPSLFPERYREIRLSDRALVAAFEVLLGADFSLARSDVKGLAYEEMIRNTFDKGDHQQFFTPAPIVEFVVAMVGQGSDRVFCDPACGTGGFLVEIAKRIPEARKIIGLEIDDRLAWVSGINLLLHGAATFEARHLPGSGSLGRISPTYLGAMDVIVTNPPFGSDVSDRRDLDQFCLGKGRLSRRRGVLFIERCIEMLRPGGLLAMVIDEGVLALPSNYDVRQFILENAEILAVISLPDSAFMPYASVSTSIVLLRKSEKPSGSGVTFFAVAESIGRRPNGDSDISYDETGAVELKSDLPRILQSWQAFLASGAIECQSESLYLANPRAMLRRDGAQDNRIDFKFHHPARLAAKAGVEASAYKLLPLREICAKRNESYVPSVDFQDQAIPYTGLANIQAKTGVVSQQMMPGVSLKSAVKKYYRNDILFAKMRPELRKSAHIDFERPGYASAECVVLTVGEVSGEPVVDPYILAILLRSDFVFGQIIHLIAGIGRPRISTKDLMSVLIPIPPVEEQARIRSIYLKTKAQYETLRAEARELEESASRMEAQSVESLSRFFTGRVR